MTQITAEDIDFSKGYLHVPALNAKFKKMGLDDWLGPTPIYYILIKIDFMGSLHCASYIVLLHL
jgi:hypothetical protein